MLGLIFTRRAMLVAKHEKCLLSVIKPPCFWESRNLCTYSRHTVRPSKTICGLSRGASGSVHAGVHGVTGSTVGREHSVSSRPRLQGGCVTDHEWAPPEPPQFSVRLALMFHSQETVAELSTFNCTTATGLYHPQVRTLPLNRSPILSALPLHPIPRLFPSPTKRGHRELL